MKARFFRMSIKVSSHRSTISRYTLEVSFKPNPEIEGVELMLCVLIWLLIAKVWPFNILKTNSILLCGPQQSWPTRIP